ncbi:MAG: hypothetical protein KIIPBIDF_01961 [Candidatus Methanoperedenaceae archaeon GB50]|nr:MAG: hypothetical protein KIIPBIDF_01961 [Candidatus Methanoperedenaceae archaeon GB50]
MVGSITIAIWWEQMEALSIVRRHLNIPTKYAFIAWQTSIPFPLKDIEWFLDANVFWFWLWLDIPS